MKPMLAASKTPPLDQIMFPVLASPKLDGIRCVMIDGMPMSRSLKLIPNKYIQETIRRMCLPDLDGELMVKGDFNSVQSAIMSQSGCPDFTYNVFDVWSSSKPFEDRLQLLSNIVEDCAYSGLRLVEQQLIRSADKLQEFWDNCLALGYEGAIVRSVDGPYKYGRSTLKQGYMIKLKTWFDSEGIVIGFVEQLHNTNEAFKGELGQTKRSREQDGMVGKDTLGALILATEYGEVTVGTGFDDATRAKIWRNQSYYLNKTVTYKYQELSKYNQPRFPVFKGFRDHE